MYNFYRWFPDGKVLFLAPTKPLVSQQVEACHGVVGIPQRDTAELMGVVSPAQRTALWSSRRVFFATPQTVVNDLRRGTIGAKEVVCVVVDEAHKATGALPPPPPSPPPPPPQLPAPPPPPRPPRTTARHTHDVDLRAGQYAYVTLVSEIARQTPRFRILALSATPGSSIDAVQRVVTSLRVQSIALRTEDDPDVRQYRHTRLVRATGRLVAC